MDKKTYRPRQKLWVIYGYEGEKDMVAFDSWKEYLEWRKTTKCQVLRMIRGSERDPEVQRKSA